MYDPNKLPNDLITALPIENNGFRSVIQIVQSTKKITSFILISIQCMIGRTIQIEGKLSRIRIACNLIQEMRLTTDGFSMKGIDSRGRFQ